MKEPVDHILRPQLPWRTADSAITECGYDASKVKTLTRDEYFRRKQELGIQRTALLVCMTCANTADRWPIWDEDPRRAIDREIAWECGSWRFESRSNRLKDELLAIAALIEAHTQEFRDHIEAIKQRREWLDKKDARIKKPKIARNNLWFRPL